MQTQLDLREIMPAYPDLAGKVAVVTGGSGGIGGATCRLLAAQGVKVVVNGRNEAAIDSTVEGIRRDGGQAIGIAADCTDFAALERLREQTERELGPVDVLAAFAGGGRARPGPIQDVSEGDWRATIDANLTATFLCLKSVLPGMIERRRGSIITMASTAARLPSLAEYAYTAAKAGVVMLTRNVANDVARFGVRANCVAPAAILVERMERSMSKEQQQQVAALHPLGRIGRPEDVALVTLFLASESASWLTGLTLDIAGGRIML